MKALLLKIERQARYLMAFVAAVLLLILLSVQAGCISKTSQRSIAATACACSCLLSALPFSMPCHFCRQLRQQVAVACCATNTGCPRNGVCLPSFGGSAGASRLAINSRACAATVGKPFAARYSVSAFARRKRRRNAECAKAANTRSRSFIASLYLLHRFIVFPIRSAIRLRHQ